MLNLLERNKCKNILKEKNGHLIPLSNGKNKEDSLDPCIENKYIPAIVYLTKVYLSMVNVLFESMNNKFSYNREGEFYVLQKHTFPRLKATFNYKTPLPELINIRFSDSCEAKDMAKALTELDAFMKSIRKVLR